MQPPGGVLVHHEEPPALAIARDGAGGVGRALERALGAACPLSVRWYSTRTGASTKTCRATTPSTSSSRSRAHSMRSLMSGMASRSSVKRQAPPSISRTIAPDQRRPMSSTALWKSGQKFESCDIMGRSCEGTLDERTDFR